MTMMNIPSRTACTKVLIPRLAGKTTWITQTTHKPRNSKAVAGAIGMYAERREARIGRLNNQPAAARRLITPTNAMNSIALRSSIVRLAGALLIGSSRLHGSSGSNITGICIFFYFSSKKNVFTTCGSKCVPDSAWMCWRTLSSGQAWR